MRGVIDCVDTLLVGPTVEPLDLAEVKKALKFTPTSEDTLLDVWIAAARQHFEEQTGRQVMTARRSRRLSCAPCQREIELPFPPLQEVISVTTDDENGDPVTFDAAEYDVVLANNGPTCPRGRIRLKPGAAWPTGGPITIEYLCGYGDAPGAVPELVRGRCIFSSATFTSSGRKCRRWTQASRWRSCRSAPRRFCRRSSGRPLRGSSHGMATESNRGCKRREHGPRDRAADGHAVAEHERRGHVRLDRRRRADAVGGVAAGRYARGLAGATAARRLRGWRLQGVRHEPATGPATTRIQFDGRVFDVRPYIEIGRGDGLLLPVSARA
jgi:uncharacterized phiE125 gp8 family phage protein